MIFNNQIRLNVYLIISFSHNHWQNARPSQGHRKRGHDDRMKIQNPGKVTLNL